MKPGTEPAGPGGAAELLERWVRQYGSALYRAAYHMTGQPEDAEDLVQETFVRAWRFLHTFDPSSNARSWLFTILMNAHIDAVRRRKRRPEDLEPSEGESVDSLYLYRRVVGSQDLEASGDPAAVFFDGLVGDEVRAALGALPERYRQVLLLFAEGFSYQEIARILALPMGTVMSRLHRARALLQKSLWEYCLQIGRCRPQPTPAAVPAPCAEACRHLYGYLDRDLDPTSLAVVEQHLAVCRRCCDRLEFYRRLEAIIRESLRRPRLPRSLRSRLSRLAQLL